MHTWELIKQTVLLYSPKLVAGLGVFLAFWVASIVTQSAVARVARLRGVNEELAVFFARCARVTLLIFGAVSGLGTAGIDVSALVAGLGLTGFALGFALKDVISNALSGILVMIYKPFEKGDEITVAAFAGKVSDVNLRYTVLDAEGKSVFIPNSTMFTSPVVVTRTGTASSEG